MKKCLMPLALLMWSGWGAAVELPSAGSQLRELPSLPEAPRAAPELRIERPQGSAVLPDDGKRIALQSLRVSGADGLPTAALVQASGFVPGAAVTLSELRAMAARVAAHVQAQGYFLAQAYLPAQEIRDGAVEIAVLLGRYDAVRVLNRSPLADAQLASLVADLQGQPVQLAPLERRLLLLTDLPGVQARSTLAPGAQLGTSSLQVEATPGERVTGSVDADNTGSRYTGQVRAGATLNLNNPAGVGDVASLRALTSADGLKYLRASYQAQWGATKLGVALGQLDYRLGKEFGVLDAHGSATVGTVYGSYALVRSRNADLYAHASVDHKRFVDRTDASGTRTDKQAQVLTLNLNGQRRDGWGGGGLTVFAADWVLGRLDIQSPNAHLIDQLTLRSQGSFRKLTLSAMRVQALTPTLQLQASWRGQWASKNLDVSEKMGLGGMDGVRAYPGGEAYGDAAMLASVELRHALPHAPWMSAGRLQALAFYDVGTVRLNRRPYTSADNRRTLSGVGLGLNWLGAGGLSVKLAYARKTGGEDATSAPDRSGRVWLQVVQAF